MNEIFVEREVGGRMLRFETGKIAKLASGAIMARYAESAVLCTAMRADPRPGLDFFPLQCDYREKLTASGKFPGGFRKREGAPGEKEVLTMRMIDRPIRPLFPDGFIDEVQLQCWVMSHDGQNDTDVLACTGASAALCCTDAPFEGPVATVRVGRLVTDAGEQFVLNPTHAQMEYSDLDLVLSGHADGVNMIEVGAAEIDDDAMLKAIEFGYEEGIKPILEMQVELMEKVGATEKRPGSTSLPSEEVMEKVIAFAKDEMKTARQIKSKHERGDKVGELRSRMMEEVFPVPADDATYIEHKKNDSDRSAARDAFRTLEKKVTRSLIVSDGIRADGREPKEIRPIEGEVSLFTRTHGSTLFQRGETQSIVSCALGTGRDEQIVDGLMPEYAKKFYLHYNFPPFCVGEAGRIMGPGRRGIGHGALA